MPCAVASWLEHVLQNVIRKRTIFKVKPKFQPSEKWMQIWTLYIGAGVEDEVQRARITLNYQCHYTILWPCRLFNACTSEYHQWRRVFTRPGSTLRSWIGELRSKSWLSPSRQEETEAEDEWHECKGPAFQWGRASKFGWEKMPEMFARVFCEIPGTRSIRQTAGFQGNVDWPAQARPGPSCRMPQTHFLYSLCLCGKNDGWYRLAVFWLPLHWVTSSLIFSVLRFSLQCRRS